MDDCVFCRIIDGREPGYVVYEDEETIAILDKYPINKGHILVMPKRHYRDIFEIPPNTLCRVMETVKTIAAAVVKGLNADGVRLIQNNGSSAGQVVFHFHVHVIPYY
ncbi:MAG: HIT family protein, partial [Caldivirga sp.]